MKTRKWFGASLLFVLLVTFTLVPWAAYSQPCQEGCKCITVAQAKELYGEGNYQRCQSAPCGNEQSPTSGTILTKYCFKPACPQGCNCMTEEKAKEMGYSLCSGQQICDYDPNGKPMYCFSAASICPPACRCLTEAQAREMGYDKFCQNQRIECGKDARGYPKYCYQIPFYACPIGCVCLSREEALAQGLKDNCLDERGNLIVCGVIDAQRGIFKYCFKKPEQEKCKYDYNLGKCVGACPTGTRCQLNTIYRDPKTGKVTYAECHCK